VRFAVKYTWVNGYQHKKEHQGTLVYRVAIGLSRQKKWGQGTKVCNQTLVPTTGLAWLVITSVFVLGKVPEMLSGGCSVKAD
jgi:hypothetical protein